MMFPFENNVYSIIFFPSHFLSFAIYSAILCQAGSSRGDAYGGKLRQLESFLNLLISRIELQQIERMKYGEETEADDNTCCICYTCESDAQFVPCSHKSCYGCITRHLLNCPRCFFCNATVLEVIKTG